MDNIRMRNEVPVEETWDLRDLFVDIPTFEAALAQLISDVDAFVETYSERLTDAQAVNAALDALRPIREMIDRVGVYVSLAIEVDITDQENMKRYLATNSSLARMGSKLSFLDTQLAALDAAVLEQAKAQSAENANYLSKLIRMKPHLLSEETESVLAAFSPTFEAPYQTYSDIKFGDTSFPSFELDGQRYAMTYNQFENVYESMPETPVRRKAVRVFYDELGRHEVGTASVYNAHVQRDKIEATVRGYDSVFDFLLDHQNVTREMYDRQIDTIMVRLAPAMRKYAELLGRIHGLDRVTTADLKLEIDPTYAPEVSYEQAQRYVLDGLSILGEDYGKILSEAFSNRWIDYADNKGKRTGAFCSSPYSTHSYILSSFNHRMDEVMTLAHELGHAGHFTLAGRHQNIFNTECSMYFVEAPSTTNEIIMENYLLKQAGDDKRQRRWVLSQMVSHTYYHNFVTHLLEAAYQREVYRIVDAGGSVQADTLNGIYRDVLSRFWGDAVEIVEGSERIWMRQPHYYMGLYSYTYSAGLTIGTQMAKRIITEGDEVAAEWLEVLKLGGSKDAVGLAKAAGVDITTSKPLEDTIDYISSLIDEICMLTEALGE